MRIIVSLLLVGVVTLAAAEPVRKIEVRGPAPSEYLQFLPGNQFIEGSSGQMTIWDLAQGKPVKILGSPEESVGRFGVSSDGKRILAVNRDKIEYWDVASGKLLFSGQGHTEATESAQISPDGLMGATGGRDNLVFLWNLATGTKSGSLKGHQALVYSVAFGPDSKLLASGSVDGTVKLWNLSDLTLKATLKGHREMVTQVAFLPTGKTVVSASSDSTVKLWDVATGKVIASLKQRSSVSQLAISADGTKLLCDTFDGYLAYWDLTTLKLLWTVHPYAYPARGLSISPDGRTALSMDFGTQVSVWDLTSDPNKLTAVPVAAPFAFDRLYSKRADQKVDLPDGTWAIGAFNQGFEVYNGFWARLGRGLRSIAGRDLQYWAVGEEPRDGGYVIWNYGPEGWKEVSGGAMQIAVDGQARPWIVNDQYQILRREGASWVPVPSPPVWRLAIGRNGSAWMIDKNYKVFQLVGTEWQDRNKGALDLAVATDGTPYVYGPGQAASFWRDGKWQPFTKFPYITGLAFGKAGLTVVIRGGQQVQWYSQQPVERDGDSIRIVSDAFEAMVLP